MASSEAIHEQALDWAVRTGDPAFTDWAGFTAWLEADPAHAQAYDAISASVAEGAELLRVAGPANDISASHEPVSQAPVSSRRRWLGGVLAASVALVVGVGLWQRERADLYEIATAPGEIRTLTMRDGTSIALSGQTTIELDHNDPRRARLKHGEALFTVRYDADAPFRVAVGEDRLVDIGTVFDVRLDRQGMSVAVSEGAVQFNPDAQNVRIDPGQRLSHDIATDRYVLSAVAVGQVGEWRQGRLTFEQASLERVASDLTRVTGIPFSAGAPGGKPASISGSVLIAPIRKDPQAIGDLLGLEVIRTADGWSLAPL
ncbi:FecR family protein [Novosphingobium mangrovi (ex Huang et al. 2023)]|uniref:FecR domain-containing protein n=1 Tax=Novosphingobium mangrovi (ex Huang et al. 2023) TaxID=2976432 RepID=A0ABT2I0X7_9SPHN|nr:FecR domain-containing protein [Novosphingobium mangrovi (ex Huang et al. 2023)]MCT2398456.1 FecR domain-containing protein [Novosphingobium mangrovi (ex Huang et al. 2023)]